jgi:hypothetical protein
MERLACACALIWTDVYRKLALHGLGAEISTLDLSDNPLVSLDWQGRELWEDMGAVEGIMRRAFSMNLIPGLLGLRQASPVRVYAMISPLIWLTTAHFISPWLVFRIM